MGKCGRGEWYCMRHVLSTNTRRSESDLWYIPTFAIYERRLPYMDKNHVNEIRLRLRLGTKRRNRKAVLQVLG
jgi:hypothetical protein